MQYEVEVNGRVRQVSIHRVDGRFVASLDGEDWCIDAVRVDPHTLSLLIDEAGPRGNPAASAPRGALKSHEVTLAHDPASGQIAVAVRAIPLSVTLNGRRRWGRKDDGTNRGGGPQRIVAPMPGKIVRILVKAGQAVLPRQPIVVIEAMKMENELRASAEGVVAELHVEEGQSVDAGTLLVVLGPA